MTKDKLDALAHTIAADTCRSIIEGHTRRVIYAGKVWYDLNSRYQHRREFVQQAIRYLTARKLLIRNRDVRALARTETAQPQPPGA